APRHLQFQRIRLLHHPMSLYLSQSTDLVLPNDHLITLDERGEEAWSAWFPTRGMEFREFCQKIGMEALPRQLSIGSADAVRATLRENPDLAREFAGFRKNALESEITLRQALRYQ